MITKNDPPIIALSIVVSAILLIRTKVLFYGIFFTPIIDIILVYLLISLLIKLHSNEKSKRIVAIIPMALILGAYLSSVYLPIHNYQKDYHKAIRRIRNSINPSDVIMAQQVYWLGITNQKYYSWEELIYYQRFASGSTIEDALIEFQPDILILDDHMRYFISDNEKDDFYNSLRIPASEFNNILDEKAELISEFEGDFYGLIQVYRLDWNSY